MSAAAGWYPQPDGQQRYWDGELWTEHLAPGVPEIVPDNIRKAHLAQAVQQEVFRGSRVEAQGEFYAVIRFGKPVNHVLHLLLTILTLGLWALVWIGMAVSGTTSNFVLTLTVDEYGNVLSNKS